MQYKGIFWKVAKHLRDNSWETGIYFLRKCTRASRITPNIQLYRK